MKVLHKSRVLVESRLLCSRVSCHSTKQSRFREQGEIKQDLYIDKV